MAVAGAFLLTAVMLERPDFARQNGPAEQDSSALTKDMLNRERLGTLGSPGGYFIENRGQVAEGVRYYSRGNPAVAFRDDGIMFVLRDGNREQRSSDRSRHPTGTAPVTSGDPVSKSLAYLVSFEDADRIAPVGIDRLPFNNNFFLGSDAEQWRTDVPSYGGIVYRDLYEGIDLYLRPSTNGMKYEFHVHAGADPGAIAMTYEGVSSLDVSESVVRVQTTLGVIEDSAPISYQGDGATVRCPFTSRDGRSVGFLCESWNRSEDLVIDPLVYSTLIGGMSGEFGDSIAIDSAGNAYVAGWTVSTDFPTTPGAFDIGLNQSDGFVLKLSPTGGSLLYSTYIGGSDGDDIKGLGIDSAGNAYVAGETSSMDFPVTAGAYDTVHSPPPSNDAFVTKLNPLGNSLSYSTLLGGGSDDEPFSLAVDDAGEAYVAGWTSSTDFPVTPGSYDTVFNSAGNDGFVTRLSPDGSALVYSTFLGGNGTDCILSIAVNVLGEAYVTGWTRSSDFPTTPGSFDSTYGGNQDGFVTKLDASGSRLLFSTYLGGGDEDSGGSIAVGPQRDAYVTGWTFSPDFPVTPDAFDITCGIHGDCDFNGISYIMDAFATRLNFSGDRLAYSTYLGGSAADEGTGLAIDSDGKAYVAGYSSSADFPVTSGTFDSTLSGRYDVFATKLNTTGDAVNYSTFLGGADRDDPWSATVDESGFLYLAGQTWSPDFPTTPGAFDTSLNGGRDVFVTKLEPVTPDLAISPADIAFTPPGPVTVGTSVTIDTIVHNIGDGNATQVTVRFFDGPPLGGSQIDGDVILPLLGRNGGSVAFPVSWNAATAGIHNICVLVDPDNTIPELSETNNQACAPIDVRLLTPDLTVSTTDLSFLPPPPFVEGANVSVTATVHNVGGSASGPTAVRFHLGIPPSPQIGTDQPLPSLPMDGTATVTVSWIAGPPGSHDICVLVDPENLVAESNETNNIACVTIEVLTLPDYLPVDTQPASPIAVGLSMHIGLSLSVLNAGGSTPTSASTISFSNSSTPSSPFFVYDIPPIPAGATIGPYAVNWTSPATPGTYLVSAHVDPFDYVNESDETNNVHTWTFDVVSGPVTSLIIGIANYTASETYVKSSTPLDFTARDRSGIGIRNTTYRIDGGGWVNYTATGQFNLAGRGNGRHLIEWHSTDWAGNVEDVVSKSLFLDDTPPVTSILPATGPYTTSTVFDFTATDSGSGVRVTRYRMDGGGWNDYSIGFTLSEGRHTISFYSIDNLDNTETERSVDVNVTTTTPPSVEANYKPVVAVIFAIILAVAGVWSSRRRPWKDGKEEMAVVKAFAITSMPLVLAEVATGVLSFLTGELRIPRPAGIGVDLGILMTGLAVAVCRASRKASEKT